MIVVIRVEMYVNTNEHKIRFKIRDYLNPPSSGGSDEIYFNQQYIHRDF